LEALDAVNISMMLIGLIVVAGILSSLVAERVGAPLLLVFLVLGMLAGEDGPGGVEFDDFSLTYFIGSIALAVILFDGGLRMRLSRFRSAFAPAAALATAGVLLTAAIAGLAATLVLGASLVEGMLIGSIVASTDAAAVLFLVGAGGLLLKRRVGATLEIEAGANDPVAVILTLLLVQLVQAPAGVADLDVAAFLVQQVLVGLAGGMLGGFAITAALNRLSLPAGLPPLFVVAAAIGLFGLTATLGGSGFLAVYAAGLVVGNRPVRAYASVQRFHDAATWLAQMVMFLVLGILVTPSRLIEHVLPAIAIAAVLMLVARPVAVWLCLTPFGYSLHEKAFISWVGLRGAVSIFLAALPVLAGAPGGSTYFDIAFVVVLVSLTLQGWTVGWAARLTGVARQDTAASVNRVEIDLPGRLDLEVVGYPVSAGSYVLSRGRLPRWLRPLLVLRRGDAVAAAESGPLEAGDFAYFLAPRNRLRLLNRIFAPVDQAESARGDGLFSFPGGASIDEVAALYAAAAPQDVAGGSIAAAFDLRGGGAPDVGDRIELGEIALVAAAVGTDGVTSAWLDLEPRAGGAGFVAAAAGRRIGRALRQAARRIARRVQGTAAPRRARLAPAPEETAKPRVEELPPPDQNRGTAPGTDQETV
jgi:cell volume regulation protein A